MSCKIAIFENRIALSSGHFKGLEKVHQQLRRPYYISFPRVLIYNLANLPQPLLWVYALSEVTGLRQSGRAKPWSLAEGRELSV